MKYRTKKSRLLAVADAYRAARNVSAVNLDDVAAWAIANDLYPVPQRGDDLAACEAWERKLADVISAAEDAA